MKCKECGYPRARFVVSRKRNWKGRSTGDRSEGMEPRKDFRVKCPKCGAEYVDKPEGTELPVEVTPEAPKRMGFYVRCTKTGEELVNEASCPQFEPLNPVEKKRCWNCKFHEKI